MSPQFQPAIRTVPRVNLCEFRLRSSNTVPSTLHLPHQLFGHRSGHIYRLHNVYMLTRIDATSDPEGLQTCSWARFDRETVSHNLA